MADQGASFWIPGFWGSLAATPQRPGWSITTFYYHTAVSSDGTDADSDTVHIIPWYTFATPILGLQPALGVMGTVGRAGASMNETTVGTSTSARPFRISDSLAGFGDPAPFLVMRWNEGVNNFMTYAAVGIPVGTYASDRLANLAMGHWAIDAGAGYTYFNSQTGYEFSTALGFTYNFVNPSTHEQNGTDMHIDWGASRFVTKQVQVGLVGYLYDQISCDGGSGDQLGCFQSRVAGVGPEIGYDFPIGPFEGYVNLKGYGEFASANRLAGWNLWLTFAISLGHP